MACTGVKRIFTRGFQYFFVGARVRCDDILNGLIHPATSIECNIFYSIFIHFWMMFGCFFLPVGSFLGVLTSQNRARPPSGSRSRSRILGVLLLGAPWRNNEPGILPACSFSKFTDAIFLLFFSSVIADSAVTSDHWMNFEPRPWSVVIKIKEGRYQWVAILIINNRNQ